MVYRIPKFLQDFLANSDVKINGTRPWDIQLHNPAAIGKIMTRGTLGIGESYMDGWWDCAALDECTTRIFRQNDHFKLNRWDTLPFLFDLLKSRLLNLQSKRRAFQVGEQHYDIGNDIFTAMLDENMIYSCGYWEYANNLDGAQLDKLDMVCQKLKLSAGETLLDIGCGWGGLAIHAAKHYGVSVVGLTVSREQQKLAQQKCVGLPIEIHLQDYRQMQGQFDKIVSVGMFEAVGPRNFKTYFDTVQRLLKPDGLFLLHTIGNKKSGKPNDPWLDRYIFPNGFIPSRTDIVNALDSEFMIEDWHNFGHDYDRTLMAWLERFNAAWPQLSKNYSERFRRMWWFYLMTSAAYFRSRRGYLWQLVISHAQMQNNYRSVRFNAITKP